MRYSFAAANAGAGADADDRIYGLQVTLNGTVVGEALMSANMVADEYYSVGGQFAAESSAYELGVSWGVVAGTAGAEGNVFAVMDVTDIGFNLEEDFE